MQRPRPSKLSREAVVVVAGALIGAACVVAWTIRNNDAPPAEDAAPTEHVPPYEAPPGTALVNYDFSISDGVQSKDFIYITLDDQEVRCLRPGMFDPPRPEGGPTMSVPRRHTAIIKAPGRPMVTVFLSVGKKSVRFDFVDEEFGDTPRDGSVGTRRVDTPLRLWIDDETGELRVEQTPPILGML